MYRFSFDAIAAAAKNTPEKIAFIHFSDYQVPNFITYSQFDAQICRVANLIRKVSKKEKPVISSVMNNNLFAQYILWGSQKVGIINPINPLLSAKQISEIASVCNAEILFLDKSHEEKADEIRKITKIDHLFIVDENFLSLLPQEIEANQSKFDEGEIAAYFHTGGTTGSPKIVPLSHKNCISNSYMMKKALDSHTNDVFLCGLPLFHVNAIHITSMVPFLTASTIVLPNLGFRNKHFFSNFWNVVETYKISLFSSVPTILTDLMSIPKTKDQNLSSLRYAIAGAAPLSVEVFNNFESMTGLKILEGYGLTESTCAVCCNPITGKRKIGSVGLPNWGCEVKVCKIDNKEKVIIRDCDQNEPGHVLIKGPNVFSGYLSQRDNKDVWLDSWFDTGDIGKLDEDGYLWLTSRSKDIIIRGGHNIDPRPIEEFMHKHPAIKLAACVGKPDPRLGEVPVCFVTLNDGHTFSERSLIDYLITSDLEQASIPKQIFPLKDMPLTPVGKIFKPELRRLLSAEK